MRLIAVSTLLLLLLATGCKKDRPKDGGGSGSAGSAALTGSAGSAGGAAAVPGVKDLDSRDVLARTTVAKEAFVRHILLAWRDLEAFYVGLGGDGLDPRAKARDNEAAAKLAQELLAQVRSQPDSLDQLIEQHSEDPGSRMGDPYRIEPGAGFAQPFVNLALRLREQEAGIVRTDFGYHVMVRIPKPPADPLESADILKRDEEMTDVHFQHIVIGWNKRPANPDPRAKARTKEAADTLAKDLLAKVRGKGDMAKLMKEHSEDPRSKDSARIYAAQHGSPDPIERLALRLKVDEAGIARSALGWHIVKRVVPPPPEPDKLESLAILKRKRVTEKAKVKHILVGWAEVNGGDERALNRSRAQLEKLVPEILAKAKKGEPFERLMIAHSEDAPEAVKSGNPYDVTPDAPLVLPFIELSLRLNVGEIGVVRTDYGLHIIKRVE